MNSITRFDHTRHNEIDLIALGRSVWKQKRLVALIGLVFASLAGFYAFTATKQYEVGSVLRPIAMNEFDALNRSGVYKLSPKNALMRVAASLDSYEARLGFYRSNPELFEPFRRDGRSDEQVFDDFNRDSLKLDLPDSKTLTANTYIGLKLGYPEGVDGVKLLNGLVAYAVESERQQVAADVDVIVQNRIRELNGKLEIARETYDNDKKLRIAKLLEGDELRRAKLLDELQGLRLQLRTQRSARIAQLDEAISIARGLGIVRPTTPSALGQGEPATQGSVIRTEIFNQQIPLYFMGTEALMAERQALRQRSSDDFTAQRIAVIAKELQLLKVNREVEVLQARENEEFFLKDVEGYRAELIHLRNLGLNMDQLKLVSIDRQALEPLAPIKPRKALVVFLGLVVGILMGVGVASVRHLIANHRLSAHRIDAAPTAKASQGAIEAS
ncbi:LPS O-antigen chain length determinant protein WzzB [Pseudomonas sp. V1]|uniref:Wzz/FepE/Etk N-terminal domain-containing protein n=1 Tax=Pseudomonas arcuscaelestis TaxID=2710591 RepID=UPI00193FE353|nr:Wzz/FepE/Etk N-terminal domain-containing protein [Pseudomonas arcuscaelestis]MBM3106687.1 LPS O-antigen chain length determinant protein WzzB [Pseudomonas arcuscaelestis]